MHFFRQVVFIARIESRFFVRYPKMLLATLAVALIPALYAVIYLSAVWDPAANTGALAVALVNLDEGVEYRGYVFNVGAEVISRLKKSHTFGFKDYTDEQQARLSVRQGKLAFALIIPRDFSSNAIPGAEAGGGKLVIHTSEGNSFESANLARHFASELGHEVNESLNERRWALVLSNATGSQRSVDRLRDGVDQLRSGAQELASGADQTATGARAATKGAGRLNDGVGQMTSGVRQLGTGLRTMEARRPPDADLTRLTTGAEALAAGHEELGRGLTELKAGSQRIKLGVETFKDETSSSFLVTNQLTEGVSQLASSVSQLDAGLAAAGDAQQKLTEGAGRLSMGVGSLTSGVRALGNGMRTMISKLPDEGQLDGLDEGAGELMAGTFAVSDGTQKIKAGAQHLTAGLNLLSASLPAAVPKPDGSAQGLANSVEPHVEVDAMVQNNGSGFAPNVIPGALWLGAAIAAFLINVRVLPRHAQSFSTPAQFLGKFCIPAIVVVAQALLVLLTVQCVLHMHIVQPAVFALTLVIASLTFLCIVFALTRAFGDAGKALAMIFLAVQLSSSGGIIPVELSGSVFVNISPWLPLTWVVRALKASMFGAYDGVWQQPLLLVTLAGAAAAALAASVGRWRYVRHTAMRPAIDL